MTPYYEASGVTIYHGDCADIVPGLGLFDLLLTDPPYGIGMDAIRHKQSGTKYGKAATNRGHYPASDWDTAPPSRELLELCRAHATHAVIWGGNYFELPPARCWLVWDKDNGTTSYADCELAWTNLDSAVRLKRYRWNGMLQEPGRPKEKRLHPTQKPEGIIHWAVAQAPTPLASVLDPFMGSGTTLRVAKDRGLRAVGIDREERYCEMAAKRLRQEVMFV